MRERPSYIQRMASTPSLTVFYDGACPLCLREIGLLRRLDGRRGRINFEDVSQPDAAPSCLIEREVLMARFHARLPSGEIVSGARAFTEAWSRIPYFIWLRPIGRFAPTRGALNLIYRGFLKIRPGLQRLAARTDSRP